MNVGVLLVILKMKDLLTPGLSKAVVKMKVAGKKMIVAGQAMTKAITLPIVAIGGAAVLAFAKFDKAMTESLAIMGEVSAKMRGEMVAAAKEVAVTTVFSATEAAESYFFLASAGLDAAQSIAALPKVAAFAQAGAFDMARATDLLTDAQSALGLVIRDDVVANMENMARVSDVLVKANTLANASVEQFSTALTSKAGAALKGFNIDIEEGVAVLAAYADQGVKAELAGNGLDRILRLLPKGALENEQAFKDAGIAVFDAGGNMNNLGDIIAQLETRLEGMGDKEKIVELNTLGFGARVQQLIKPLLGTSDAIKRYEKELRAAGGTTQEVADKQMKSFANQMGILKDKLVGAFISLGETLVPILNDTVVPMIEKLIGGITSLVEWFGNLPPSIQGAIAKFLLIAAAAGPVLVVIGKLVTVVGLLSGSIAPGGALATGFVWLMAAIGPVGWLIIGIAAVAGALATFVAREGGAFENWFAGTTETIKEFRGEFGATSETLKTQQASMALLTETAKSLNQAIADGVPGAQEARDALIELNATGQPAERTLSELATTMNDGTDAGNAMRVAMIEGSTAVNAAARAADAAAKAKARLAIQQSIVEETALQEAEALEAVAEALKALGIVTAEDALAQFNELELAFQGATKITLPQLIEKSFEVEEALRELGVLTPELATKFRDLRASVDEMSEGQSTAKDRIDEFLAQQPKLQLDLGKTEESFKKTAEQGAAVFSQRTEDARQKAEEFTSEVSDAAGELGNFLGSFKTGIPAIDGFLGKMQGVVKMFSDLVGGIGKAISGIGNFFSKLAGGQGFSIPGLGGGGGGIPGLGGIDIISKLGGLFGIGGGAAAAAAPTLGVGALAGLGSGAGVFGTLGGGAGVLGIGGGAATAGTTAGATAGTTFLGTLGSTISGGISSVMSAVVPLLTNPLTIGIGAAVIAGFVLYKKLKGPSQLERIGRDAGKFMGLGMSGELAKKIESMSRGDDLDVGAIFQNLPAIAAEAGGLAGSALSKTLGFGVKSMIIQLREAKMTGAEFTRDFRLGLVPLVDGFVAAKDAGKLTTSMIADMNTALSGTLVAAEDGFLNSAEAAAIFHDILPSLKGNMEALGLKGVQMMQEVADRMTNLGIVGADTYRKLADEAAKSYNEQQAAAEASLEAAETGYKDALDQIAVAQKALTDATTEEARAQAAEMIKAANFAAAEWKKELDSINKVQEDVSQAAVRHANDTGAAWKRAAEDASEAWDDTRDDTVGGSSILDIARLGIKAANDLKKKQVTAAEETKAAWLATSKTGFFSGPVNLGPGSVSGTLPPLPTSGGKDGAAIQIFLDGKIIAESTVKHLPAVLRQMGFSD